MSSLPVTSGSTYPVGYQADFAAERSRATTFFRSLMVIPAQVVMFFYSIALMFTWPVAGLALLFTGRYPEGLYRFNAKMLRFTARANAYQYLLTDQFPPLDLDEHPEYPVRVDIGAPAERYSRAKVFFRGLIGIPVMFVAFFLAYGLMFMSFVTWFRVVFTGQQQPEAHRTMERWSRYLTRTGAYFMYLTEVKPPSAAGVEGAGQGQLAPATA